MLRSFDLYGSKINLSFQNSSTYKTKFGGILTILTILILISSTIVLSISLFNRDNFKIITCTTIDSNSNYDFSQIPILIGLTNYEGMLFSDKKLFNIRLIAYHYHATLTSDGTRAINITNKELQYENCEKYKNNNSYFKNNTFANITHSLYQCIKPGQNLTFYGKHGDLINGFRNLVIIIDKCNNETLKLKNENFSCYSEEEINKKLTGLKLILLYVSYNLNHFSFNGHHIFFKEAGDYFNFPFPVTKTYSISFSKNVYFTDTSMLFNFRDKKEFFSYSGTSSDLDTKSINYLDIQPINDDTVGTVLFNMDGTTIEYNRSYEKILSLLINLGGIYNFIIAVFKLITKFTTEKMKVIDLIKKISVKTYNLKRTKSNLKIKKLNNQLNNQTKSNMILNNNDNKIIIGKHSNYNSAQKIFASKNFCNIVKNNINSSNDNIRRFSINNEIHKIYNKNKIISENIKKIGFSFIWFYICPFEILKKCKKFRQFNRLYMMLLESLSIENYLAMSNKWSISEVSVNENSNNNLIRYYSIKEMPITFNSLNGYHSPVLRNNYEGC